jgi:hypothetical protein
MTYFEPTNLVFSGFRAVGLKWSGTCAAVANRDARMIGTSISHTPIILFILPQQVSYPWPDFGVTSDNIILQLSTVSLLSVATN